MNAWVNQRDKGSAALVKFMAFISLRIGSWVGRALLYPICIYYLVFAPIARRASRDYLSLALGRPSGMADVFRHFHVRANVLLDRLLITAGGMKRFRVQIHGLDVIERLVQAGQGCILLGAHIGSFEIMRTLANEHEVPVKVMMYLNTSRKFNRVMESLNPSFMDSIIPLGHPTSIIVAGQFVRQGGMVAILGDRLVTNDKTAEVTFFGRVTKLPIGPLLLSSILQVPIIFFVAVYERDGSYIIHFEELSNPPEGTSRSLPNEVIADWVERYAQRLERHCRLSPYNWFNFYDFWRH